MNGVRNGPALSGPWTAEQIERHLATTVVPVRLACVAPSGWPVSLSLWFLYEDGALFCASRKGARVVRILESAPRCGFEVAGEAPPYHGVRGQGLAALDPAAGPALLPRLIDRYLGPGDTPFRRWLMRNAADEVAIRIAPQRLMNWDYRRRMSEPAAGG
ncbi:MAG: pyridoxamine 5'-phosphate oxidase family protein [Alphaproteobacteria bacterium]